MTDDIEIYAGENWETAHVPVAWVHDVLDRLEVTLQTGQGTGESAAKRLHASQKLVAELKNHMQAAQNELGIAIAATAGTGEAIVSFWEHSKELENLCHSENGSSENLQKASRTAAALRDLLKKIDC